ncbi:Hypp7522 [Branchiostoma lanceolatum]|uniref:Hypp7522 protein n=1 Tax=Branchiostoma lanceolatum TaxID=7740 RepID=A0A8J9Z147_BRALA|nr:Hypp7522 [Branchiostoma lanceolatum]
MWALRHCRDLFAAPWNWRERLGGKPRAVAMWSVQTQSMAGKPQEVVTPETETCMDGTALGKQGGPAEPIEPHSKDISSIEAPSIESSSIDPPSIEPPSTEPPSIEPPSIESHSIEPPSIEPHSIEPAVRASETDSETTRREPLWTEAEMERFWAVLEPHVRRLSAGEAAVPVCTIELVDPDRGLDASDLRLCLWDVQELIWAGRYSQALAGLRKVRELVHVSREGREDDVVTFLDKEKDEVELFKELFMKLEPVRRRQMNNFKQVTFMRP